jgi:hypothetical protein
MNKNESKGGLITSGESISYWIDTVKPLQFDSLNESINCS